MALAEREGAGKARCRLAPVAPVRKEARGENHRFSRIDPAFPARWFDGLYVVSPGTGCFAPVARRIIITTGLTSASGCQDHTTSPAHRAVRPHDQHAATRCAHRIPHSTLVTIAMAPLCNEAGCRERTINSVKTKQEYFCAGDWTGQISLSGLAKSASARRPFRRAEEPRLRRGMLDRARAICPTSGRPTCVHCAQATRRSWK